MKDRILKAITGITSVGVWIFPCFGDSESWTGIAVCIAGEALCLAWLLLFQYVNGPPEYW